MRIVGFVLAQTESCPIKRAPHKTANELRRLNRSQRMADVKNKSELVLLTSSLNKIVESGEVRDQNFNFICILIDQILHI